MRAGLLLPALLLAFPVAGEAQVAMTAETVIRGVVFDSLNMRPLAEATVQIAAASGTSWVRTYETDSNGTFEFTAGPKRDVPDWVLPRESRRARSGATGVPSGGSRRTADAHGSRDSIGSDDRALVMR
jgi:hypothetical protein